MRRARSPLPAGSSRCVWRLRCSRASNSDCSQSSMPLETSSAAAVPLRTEASSSLERNRSARASVIYVQFFGLLELLSVTLTMSVLNGNVGIENLSGFLFRLTKFCNDFFTVRTLASWCCILTLTASIYSPCPVCVAAILTKKLYVHPRKRRRSHHTPHFSRALVLWLKALDGVKTKLYSVNPCGHTSKSPAPPPDAAHCAQHPALPNLQRGTPSELPEAHPLPSGQFGRLAIQSPAAASPTKKTSCSGLVPRCWGLVPRAALGPLASRRVALLASDVAPRTRRPCSSSAVRCLVPGSGFVIKSAAHVRAHLLCDEPSLLGCPFVSTGFAQPF